MRETPGLNFINTEPRHLSLKIVWNKCRTQMCELRCTSCPFLGFLVRSESFPIFDSTNPMSCSSCASFNTSKTRTDPHANSMHVIFCNTRGSTTLRTHGTRTPCTAQTVHRTHGAHMACKILREFVGFKFCHTHGRLIKTG